MKVQFYLAALLVLIALAAQRTSAEHPFDQFKWLMPATENLSSINLFKEYFGYFFAVLGNGIPSLNISPLDPFSAKSKIIINPDKPNPDYKNYSSISIELNDITISNFSKAVARVADRNAETMSSNVSLFFDTISLYWKNMTATVNTTSGHTLQYNCTGVETGIGLSQFNSTTQLHLVNGTVLQVKQMKMSFENSMTTISLNHPKCKGNAEIVWYVMDTITEMLNDVTGNIIPQQLNDMSQKGTYILNEILAIRNVTDDGDHVKPQHKMNRNSLMGTNNGKFSTTRYHDKTNKVNDSGLKIKWL